MKKVNLVLLFVMVITMISCGEKKEQDSFGKQDSSSVPTEVLGEDPLVAENSLVSVGKEIFEGKGTCVACHQPDTKTVGPSVQEIAKIYNEKNSDIVIFLKGEGEPIVDPSQYEVMKANFAITKQMSDEELKSIEAYINSYLK
jgi:cytochrome c